MKMSFREALIEIRRKIGLINFNSKEDVEWLCHRIINTNRKVFDELAKEKTP